MAAKKNVAAGKSKKATPKNRSSARASATAPAQRYKPTKQALAQMRRMLRAGFPLTTESAGDIFVRMAVVRARAPDPDSWLARVKALDTVLREVLLDLGEGPRGKAARVVFALEPPPGRDERFLHEERTLTSRRQYAARVLGCAPETFRRYHEPRILADVIIDLVRRDNEYKARTPRAPGSLVAKGPSPDLDDSDLSEREELISDTWSHVYGLRAALIASMRSAGLPKGEVEYSRNAGRALWHLARLLETRARYLDRYGDELLHGGMPYSAEGVVRLAGWRGELDAQDERVLRYGLARAASESPAGLVKFLERTVSGREVLSRWAGLLEEWRAARVARDSSNEP